MHLQNKQHLVTCLDQISFAIYLRFLGAQGQCKNNNFLRVEVNFIYWHLLFAYDNKYRLSVRLLRTQYVNFDVASTLHCIREFSVLLYVH